MDPITILTTVLGLVGTALKGIQAYNSYHDQYSRAAITVASMMAQCSCVEFALLQVQDVVMHNAQSAYLLRSNSTLMGHFSTVFGTCQLVFSILNQRLKGLVDDKVSQRGEMSTMTKLKYVWNDQEMKDLLRNLESQASAMNLLLSALQMQSNAEVHNLLIQQESCRLLDKVSDNASSLKAAEDARICDSTVVVIDSVEPSLHSTFSETEFAFDFELINTTAYRKAFYHASKHSLSQPTEGIIIHENGAEDESRTINQHVSEVTHTQQEQPANSHGQSNQYGVSVESLPIVPTGSVQPILVGSVSGYKIASDSKTQVQTDFGGDQEESTNAMSETTPSDFEILLIDLSIDDSENKYLRSPPFLSDTMYQDLMELEDLWKHSDTLNAGIDRVKAEEMEKELHSHIENDLSSTSENGLGELDSKLSWLLEQAVRPSLYLSTPETDLSLATSISSNQLSNVGGYSIHGLIHKSASASVMIGYKGHVSNKIAMKVIRRQDGNSETALRRQQTKRIYLEIATLHDLSHPSIIRIHEFMELSRYMVIVMPHISSCTLLNYILRKRKATALWHFSEDTARELFKQLLSGVKYLHDNQTIHHNLTLDNLLYDSEQERIVINGFNLAEVVPRFPETGGQTPPLDSSNMTSLTITGEISPAITRKPVASRKYINPYFTAPEILASDCDPHSDPYSILDPVHIKGKVDVYSCGAILLALLDGVLPYNGNMVMTLFSQFHATEHYTHMMNTPLSRTLTIQHRNTSWGTRDLLLKLLEVNPKSRYTVLQAVRHPWCCSVSLESAVRFAVQCGE